MHIPKGMSLFVIDLKYTLSLEQVDPLIEAHIEFLDKHYAKGLFLVSGAKVPRDGGVILAVSKSKSTILQLIKDDPFYTNNAAKYTITEFMPSKTANSA